MLKSELIDNLAARNKYLEEKDINLGITLLLGYLSDNLAKGKRIEIRGFGGFTLHHRKPRKAHNPKTKEKVVTKEKYAVHFKPGKELRQRVDDSKLEFPIIQDDSYDDENIEVNGEKQYDQS
jgi:integration host factor subunit beta